MTQNETGSFPKIILDHHRKDLAATLDRWQEDKKVPPTLLLTGTPGGGTEPFARYLAQWLHCDEAGFSNPTETEDTSSLSLFGDMPEIPKPHLLSKEPCGKCHSCRRFNQNQPLDFFEIKPQASESGKSSSLKIDQFDLIRNQLGFGPKEAAFKIFIIQNTEQMTPQAANSLLKVLEEPPHRWIFILTTSDPSLILPTIVSRCQVLRLKPINPLTLEKALVEEGLPSERLRAALDESGASFQKSIRFQEDTIWEMRSKVRDFIARPQHSMGDLLDWASAKHESFVELLDTLDHYGTQILKGGAKAPRKDLENPAHVVALLEKTFETRVRLSTPVNRKLLAQNLLSQWSQ